MTFDQKRFDAYNLSSSPSLRAFYQGYNGLPLTAISRENTLAYDLVEAHYFDGISIRLEDGYLQSVIDRATVTALIRLEVTALEQEYKHEEAIQARGGDVLLNTLLLDRQITEAVKVA